MYYCLCTNVCNWKKTVLHFIRSINSSEYLYHQIHVWKFHLVEISSHMFYCCKFSSFPLRTSFRLFSSLKKSCPLLQSRFSNSPFPCWLVSCCHPWKLHEIYPLHSLSFQIYFLTTVTFKIYRYMDFSKN